MLILMLFLASANAHAATDGTAARVMRTQCGACHDPKLGAVNPRALKIFDLSIDTWLQGMSERQMGGIVRRLKDRTSMTAAELSHLVPSGTPTPASPSPEEIKAVEDSLGLEMQRRVLSRVK